MKSRYFHSSASRLTGLLALIVAPTVLAQPLIVVDDRGGVSALPYYQALNPQDTDSAEPFARASVSQGFIPKTSGASQGAVPQTSAVPNPIAHPSIPQARQRVPNPVNPTNPAEAEALMLPVRSTLLSPGNETPRVLRAPGLTPLFLIGDDEHSRNWLRQKAQTLRELGAVGLVVNVESMAALKALRELAHGLSLSPVSGDDLAHRLGLRHYPVLITATGIEP